MKIILMEQKLNSGATEMKSQADASTWRDGACLPRPNPRRDVLRAVLVFSGFFKLLRTISSNRILWIRVKGSG